MERARIITVEGNVKTTLRHILLGQNGLALSLHNDATSEDGRTQYEDLATVFTIESGLVTRIDTYLSDVPNMEQYFAK